MVAAPVLAKHGLSCLFALGTGRALGVNDYKLCDGLAYAHIVCIFRNIQRWIAIDFVC